jgi:hypothetical protein
MQKHYRARAKTNKNTTKKHKHQKVYKMRGSSKKTSRNYLGGNNSPVIALQSKAVGADYNLAYPYNGPVVRNTALAYTGKGGYKSANALFPEPSNLAVVTTSNPNGVNPLYPNTGPPIGGFNFLNPVNQQRGGGCGCGGLPFMSGGDSSQHKHRDACRCSTCKMNTKTIMMKGGGGCTTGNNGIPYPNGLVGSPYSNPTNLPGANGIPGDANYYSNNTYNHDVSRQMIDVGANRPFLGFPLFKGGKRNKHHRLNHTKKNTKQRGGFLTNDLINLGRQISHGVGTTFDALNGYRASPSPLPWKDQLVGKH